MLIFFLQKNQTPANYLVLQVLSGDQGFQWNRMNVTLSSTSDFEVSIRGYKGKGYHGDIAIDDIIVYDGKCQNWEKIIIKSVVSRILIANI